MLIPGGILLDADPKMLLLTWHGTVVCLRQGGGGLVHLPLPLTDPDTRPIELALEPGDIRAEGMPFTHPALGPITIRPAPLGRGLCLIRYGRFLCAERDRVEMAFDRSAPNVWETFLPVARSDIDMLEHLLAQRWIVAASRQVLRRPEVGLAPEFRLRLGAEVIHLDDCLPLAADPADDTRPDRLAIGRREGRIELLQAEPRSSALLETALWPVRARRTAEILTLAVHRQLAGREPDQARFEADVAFMVERGPAGLAELIERHEAGLSSSDVISRASLQHLGAEIAQPVISLGTGCIVACLLRRMGLDQAPMPFDWLGTTPGMVRHCLETDFATLLDRTQYTSLTGRGREGQPEDGCAHEFYAREYGIARVFNHNDPTREADYRYTTACVDRFRDLMASDAPKLFVQIREISPAARQDFDATCDLLDRLTRNASLLLITVAPPDRRLAVPLPSISARRGAHIAYRIQATSQLTSEDLAREADRDVVTALIASHARRPASQRLVVPGDRLAVQAGASQFGDDRPPDAAPEDEAGWQAGLDRGNASLTRFLETVSLPRRFRFGSYDQAAHKGVTAGVTCLVQVRGSPPAAQQAMLRANAGQTLSWTLLHRSLALIYLLDAVFADGGVPEQSFLAEFGDQGYERRSVAFCSHLPGTCLLPDSDFFATGGYDEVRRQLAAAPQRWERLRPTVFWRGATTGRRRTAPPAEGEADDFTWLPRLDLCRRAQVSTLAEHYDVGISNICQMEEPHLVARIAGSGLCRAPVQRSGFLGHKAILVMDGNTNAWSALFCALLSGACVLKVESPHGFRQWYYDDLQPWVNFVPVSEDLNDLDERVAWLLSHDDEARAVGAAGRALAEAMSFEAVMEKAASRLRNWLTADPLHDRNVTPL